MEPDRLRTVAARYTASQDEAELLAQRALDRASWRARRGFKVCSRCGARKKPGEFGRDASRSDGLETRCRECRRSV